MIAELLSAIGSGRSWSMAELSRHLQISEGMIAQMLSDLAHRGYVEPDRGSGLDDNCPACNGCSCCAAGARLGPDGETRAWRLTEKGEQRVRKR